MDESCNETTNSTIFIYHDHAMILCASFGRIEREVRGPIAGSPPKISEHFPPIEACDKISLFDVDVRWKVEELGWQVT